MQGCGLHGCRGAWCRGVRCGIWGGVQGCVVQGGGYRGAWYVGGGGQGCMVRGGGAGRVMHAQGGEEQHYSSSDPPHPRRCTWRGGAERPPPLTSPTMMHVAWWCGTAPLVVLDKVQI